MDRYKIGKLYGMGSRLGLVGHNKDDALHDLVRAETGKKHISDLTDGEYKKVVARLAEQMPKRKRDATAPGMMTQEQINRFFAYFYQLKKLSPSQKSDRVRQASIIRYALHIDVDTSRDMFRWICRDDGARLIETIKGLVISERKKAR